MMDDGYGRNLTIPGVLISKEDGQIIKDFYTANKESNDPNMRNIKIAVKFEMVNSLRNLFN